MVTLDSLDIWVTARSLLVALADEEHECSLVLCDYTSGTRVAIASFFHMYQATAEHDLARHLKLEVEQLGKSISSISHISGVGPTLQVLANVASHAIMLGPKPE